MNPCIRRWRDDATGPMQVVSGPDHRQKVHYEAPGASALNQEMPRFFNWANATASEPPLIKAGLAHLWFVTLHPFDDGNGRIARAVGDLFLAALGGNTAERTPSEAFEQAARWVRRQAHQQQVGSDCQVLTGYCFAGYQ